MNLLLRRPHPSMQVNSSCLNSPLQWQRLSRAITSNLPPEHDKEQTSFLVSLKAQWPAEQATLNMQHFALFIRECISMATLVCAHDTEIVTNREPSELVAERIRFFYALQKRTLTCNCLDASTLACSTFQGINVIVSVQTWKLYPR